MRLLRRAIGTMALGTSIGCAAPERGPVAFSVTDSAGIQLVRNDGDPARLDSATLQLEEVLRIGVEEGAEVYQLHRIGNYAVAANGHFYVPNGGSNTIRVFDSTGAFVREFGGTGDGPGEFRDLFGIRLRADTIIATDGARTTVLDTAGRVLGSWRAWDRRRSADERDALVVSAHLQLTKYDSASWLGLVKRYDAHLHTYVPGRMYQDTLELRRYDLLTGRLLDSAIVERVPSGLRRYAVAVRGEGALVERLWEFVPASGRFADGRRLRADSTGHYRIDVTDARGGLVRRISRAHVPVALTAEHRDAFARRIHRHLDSLRGGHASSIAHTRRTLAEQLPALGHPPVLPAIRALRPTRDGGLWVLRGDLHYDPVDVAYARHFGPLHDDTPAQWERFDADGRFVGAVLLPPRFQMLSARRDDEFTGILRNVDDIEFIVSYRVAAVPPVPAREP